MRRVSFIIFAMFILGIISQLSMSAGPICLDNERSRLLLDRNKFTLIDIQDKALKTSYVIEPGGALLSVAFNKPASAFYESPATYTVDGSGARKVLVYDDKESRLQDSGTTLRWLPGWGQRRICGCCRVDFGGGGCAGIQVGYAPFQPLRVLGGRLPFSNAAGAGQQGHGVRCQGLYRYSDAVGDAS